MLNHGAAVNHCFPSSQGVAGAESGAMGKREKGVVHTLDVLGLGRDDRWTFVLGVGSGDSQC